VTRAREVLFPLKRPDPIWCSPSLLVSESQAFCLQGQSSSVNAISRVMKSSSYTCTSSYVFMACLLRAALTSRPWLVGSCHHDRALPEVADGVMASNMDGSCEYIEQAVEDSRQVCSFSLEVGRGANSSSPWTKCHVMKHFTRRGTWTDPLVQTKQLWQALVNAVMNLWVP
jgi:hypothetical protein